MAGNNASIFLSVLLLLTATSFRSSLAEYGGIAADGVGATEDLLIRQVVDGGEEGVLDENSLLNADHHFAIFKRRFNKAYRTQEEHDYRFSVFRANLHRARRHQKLDPSAVHGVTQFSDLTPREFRSQLLGVNRRYRLPSDAHKAEILPTNDLPTNFDWRDHGAVVPVKNQGSCGSCWSFSTTGALEGANFLATGKLESLSEQQLVDCDHECDPEEKDSCDSGCNGGLMNSAFEYTLKAGGLMREKDYPYTGTDRGACKFDKTKIAAKVANFSVVSLDEDQIAANLVKHGPLAVAINAVYMQTYMKGVSCPYICSKQLDHGVLLVGYGASGYAPIRMKEKQYWIIKNSWGENWGENGYYKICRGRNICGVDSMVSSVAAVKY
ncbi:cysteine protease RD19A-like [Henckelia pumila]|uniref:cysteine protease RD19A-like n=1 Tax=Henckelia pumila TaxID=405737 RepID=UPI003C6DDCDD